MEVHINDASLSIGLGDKGLFRSANRLRITDVVVMYEDMYCTGLTYST